MENKKTFLEKIKEFEEKQDKLKYERRLNKANNPQKNRFFSFLKKTLLVLLFLFCAFVALGIYVNSQETPEQKAADKKQYEKEEKERSEQYAKEKSIEDAKEKEEKLKKAQFNCTSYYDGSVYDVVYDVKKNLRDPSSFEHIETTVSPVSEKDEQVVVMRYRARNGFGGMNIESVIAVIQNSTCSLKSISN